LSVLSQSLYKQWGFLIQAPWINTSFDCRILFLQGLDTAAAEKDLEMLQTAFGLFRDSKRPE
jgi:hypothetical protein